MYAMLWRALPGHWIVRVLILAVAAAIVLWVLDAAVFPWAAELLSAQEATVGS